MSHHILTPDEIPGYLAGRPELHRFGAAVGVFELGGGYLNRVFRVSCEHGSVVLKQSMPYVRVDESWALTPTRIANEARSYLTWNELSLGMAPDLYVFDPDLNLIIVEDLFDHEIWRRALNDGRTYPEAARALGAFVARMAVRTGGSGDRKAIRESADNPEMTQLMRDVVFDFPYVDHPHNSYPDEAAGEVAALRADVTYRDAVAELRHRWSSTSESLVHGDLHTGSVMVAAHSTKVIDSEFSFYGPVAWDLGALLGNLLLAVVRQFVVTGSCSNDVRGLSSGLWSAFEQQLATEGGVASWEFSQSWLDRLRSDSLGYAGLEMVRRIIGSGKAEDLTTLGDADYVTAARSTIAVGRQLVLDRERLAPSDGPALIQDAVGAMLR